MEIHPMYYDGDAFTKQLIRLFKRGFRTKYLISAGTARPDYFINHGYKPEKTYFTGDFTRGLYTNIKDEHVIESCSNLFPSQTRTLGWLPILKRPYRVFNRTSASTKIVRAIMLQRD